MRRAAAIALLLVPAVAHFFVLPNGSSYTKANWKL